mgnify:CR=1 FL=1
MEEITKLVKAKKAVVGTQLTLKFLKEGKLSKVYLSANAPLEVKDDIKTYAAISGVEIVELDVPNDELGVICKKPFPISVLGALK